MLLAAPAYAQGGALGADRSIPPTPLPVGSGARAAGMGNAFVAIADDASAAAWNPAGLVQLERPELSIVGEGFWTRDTFSSDRFPEMDGAHAFNDPSLNFMSAVYPIPRPLWGRNIALALSYQRRYNFTRQFDARLTTQQSVLGGIILGQSSTMRFEQTGSLGALSPSLAFEITKKLSLGVSLNLFRSDWIGEDGWEQTTRVDTRFDAGSSQSWSHGISREKYENIRGASFTLGALWHPASKWTLGFRYDSALRASAEYSAFDRERRIVPNPAMPIGINQAQVREDRDLRFPATVSLGAAYRHNDRLTLSCDVSRTDWSDVYVRAADGTRYSLVDGTDLHKAFGRSNFDPAYAVRLGAEYTFIPKVRGETLDYLWTVRGGLFLEQEPASHRDPRRPLAAGSGKPDNFYGTTLGVGLLLRQRINLDAAYQYRFGRDVNGDLNPGVSDFHADEDSHRLVLSMVFYF